MKAFHNEPALKASVMNRLREHRRLDQIGQGMYRNDEDGRGCHLWCLTHDEEDPHEAAARLFGIEQRIGYWLESVFEGLPSIACAAWALDSCEAIPVGADLSSVHHSFTAWLLGESGLVAVTAENRKAISVICDLHERAARGAVIPACVWEAAEPCSSSGRTSWHAAAFSAADVFVDRSTSEAIRYAVRLLDDGQCRLAWERIAKKSLETFAAAPVDAVVTQRTNADDCGTRRTPQAASGVA